MVEHIQVKTILSFVDEVTSWAKNRADITLNETLVKKFTQSALDSAVKADFKKRGSENNASSL